MARSDNEIKQDILNIFAQDEHLDASGIDVDVKDGIVTLRGTAPSPLSETSALADTWTAPDVLDVRDEVQVLAKPPDTHPADEELQQIIWDQLSELPEVDTSNITVTVTSGMAILDGSVDAFWKKAYVAGIVEQIDGVMSIDNNLTIVPTRNIADQDIADDIERAIEADSRVSTDDVNVEVSNGIVTLTGTVPFWTARSAAYHAATRTPGVLDVIDNIEVNV